MVVEKLLMRALSLIMSSRPPTTKVFPETGSVVHVNPLSNHKMGCERRNEACVFYNQLYTDVDSNDRSTVSVQTTCWCPRHPCKGSMEWAAAVESCQWRAGQTNQETKLGQQNRRTVGIMKYEVWCGGAMVEWGEPGMCLQKCQVTSIAVMWGPYQALAHWRAWNADSPMVLYRHLSLHESWLENTTWKNECR